MGKTSQTGVIQDSDPTESGSGVVLAFLIGTAVGGVAGAVVGTLLSPYTADTLSAVYTSISERLPGNRGDRPRFELLLQ